MGAECCKTVDATGPAPTPLANPPRSGLGRERAAPIPPESVLKEDSNADLSDYVLRRRKSLLVYRCAGCGVRFGNEVDVCRQASIERAVFSVTFTQTFNLFVKDKLVCCVRCDKAVCTYDSNDERLLTLPLFHEDGTRTMGKSPLKMLCLANAGTNGPKVPSFSELEQALPERIADENGDEHSFEAVERTFWSVGELAPTESTQFTQRPDAALEIFDFVLGIDLLADVASARFGWSCSGGNILFYEAKEDISDAWEQLQIDGHIYYATEWSQPVQSNEETDKVEAPLPPYDRVPPKELLILIRKAARGQLLYPKWLAELPVSIGGEAPSPNKHDGRCRSSWKGDVEEEEKTVVEYLTPTTGELQVYRCSKCGCRIANEAEICRPANWDEKRLTATFNRTFSLTVSDNFVCCIRCGANLYPYDPCDSALLTVPLYWNGQRTLEKSPLRVLLFANPWHALLTVNEEGQEEDANSWFAQRIGSLESSLSEVVPEGWSVDPTCLVRVFRAYVDVPKYRVLNTRPLLEKYGHYSKVVQAWRDAGVGSTYHFVPHFEEETTLASLPAQDVGIYVRVLFDNSMYCSWTDYGGLWWESSLLGMWMACGGNLVFADWFTSKGVPRKHHKDPSRLDFERRAMRADNSEWWYNRQPSYAQLLRDQHYMGWWPADQVPPPFILGRMRRAVLYRQVYPHWLFLRDFPAAIFDSLVRQEHDKRRNGCIDEELFKKSPPYAARARDAVCPNKNEEDEK